MTMIVPAGRNMPEWSPKGTKLQKLASDGQEVQDQEVDALYEAAKGFSASEKLEVEAASKCDDCGKCKECKCEKDECECDICKCAPKKEADSCGGMTDEDAIVIEVEDEAVEEVGEAVEEVSDEMDAPQSVSEAVAEVEAKAEEAEAKVEAVEEALEMIDEAIQGVRDVAGTEEKLEGEGEVELEVEVEGEGEVDEIPGEEVVDSEVIVEGEGAECEAKDKTGMDKSAAAEEFCRFAKLSPQNRKKLANYWTNMLGYPRDYVSLMTKDYEK